MKLYTLQNKTTKDLIRFNQTSYIGNDDYYYLTDKNIYPIWIVTELSIIQKREE